MKLFQIISNNQKIINSLFLSTIHSLLKKHRTITNNSLNTSHIQPIHNKLTKPIQIITFHYKF
jgi:hypothetical protein